MTPSTPLPAEHTRFCPFTGSLHSDIAAAHPDWLKCCGHCGGVLRETQDSTTLTTRRVVDEQTRAEQLKVIEAAKQQGAMELTDSPPRTSCSNDDHVRSVQVKKEHSSQTTMTPALNLPLSKNNQTNPAIRGSLGSCSEIAIADRHRSVQETNPKKGYRPLATVVLILTLAEYYVEDTICDVEIRKYTKVKTIHEVRVSNWLISQEHQGTGPLIYALLRAGGGLTKRCSAGCGDSFRKFKRAKALRLRR